jgi:hypothetical protein
MTGIEKEKKQSIKMLVNCKNQKLNPCSQIIRPKIDIPQKLFSFVNIVSKAPRLFQLVD